MIILSLNYVDMFAEQLKSLVDIMLIFSAKYKSKTFKLQNWLYQEELEIFSKKTKTFC